MARTTEALVRERLGRDYNGYGNLKIPIQLSNSLVTRAIEKAASSDGVSVSTDDARYLENELACHFYCVSDRVYTSRSTLSASGAWAFQAGKGLDATPYGQSAKSFDPTGGWIEAIADGMEVDVSWLGKRADEQLSWTDRNGETS